jgi:hypothetical protein
MRILLAGGTGFARDPQLGEWVRGLVPTLDVKHHKAVVLDPMRPIAPQEFGLVAAFVDDFSPQLAEYVQDALEAGVPVLCLTDGRIPVTSSFLLESQEHCRLEITHYGSFDALCAKVFTYVNMLTKRHRKRRSVN